MRNEVLLAQLKSEFFFAPQQMVQDTIEALERGLPRNESYRDAGSPASNSVTLQKIGKLAVISVDGAMYKKDMSGMCMSVASYQGIALAINEANKLYEDGKIEKTLFRVTTPGGSVFGLDAVTTKIENMKMPTMTLYEDQGCSAGIYAFTATDKIYAAPMTELGSIGTVVHVEQDEKKKYKAITSRRAKNKSMDLSKEEDVNRLKSQLDVYEDRFYSVVEKHTGFSAEKIETEFDNGSTIMEDKALEAGFIDEVITFEELIERENMGGNTTAIPTASSDKLAQNNTQGVTMEFNKENFESLQEQNKALTANKATLEARLATANTTAETLALQLEDARAEATKVKTELEAKNEVVADMAYEALEIGASKEAFAEAIKVEDRVEASKVLIKSNSSDGAAGNFEATQESDESAKMLAWAEKNKGSIQ